MNLFKALLSQKMLKLLAVVVVLMLLGFGVKQGINYLNTIGTNQGNVPNVNQNIADQTNVDISQSTSTQATEPEVMDQIDLSQENTSTQPTFVQTTSSTNVLPVAKTIIQEKVVTQKVIEYHDRVINNTTQKIIEKTPGKTTTVYVDKPIEVISPDSIYEKYLLSGEKGLLISGDTVFAGTVKFKPGTLIDLKDAFIFNSPMQSFAASIPNGAGGSSGGATTIISGGSGITTETDPIFTVWNGYTQNRFSTINSTTTLSDNATSTGTIYAGNTIGLNGIYINNWSELVGAADWHNILNKPATSTVLSLLDSDQRISNLNSTSTLSDNATTTKSLYVNNTIGLNGVYINNWSDIAGSSSWDLLTNKPATSTTLSLLDSDKRISVLNATTTNIGTLQVYGNATTSGHLAALGGNSDQWNLAYSWGNHAAAGYASSTGLGTKLAKADFNTYFNNLYNGTTTLNGFTPSNYFLASNFNSSWAAQYNATTTLNGFTPSNYLLTTNFGNQFASSYNATTTLNGFTNNQANWNTAYSWGNHAAAGYASSTGLGTKLAKADFSTYFNNLYNATTTLNGFTPSNYFLASNFNSYFDTRLNASSTIAFGSCASNQILKWNGSAWACSADSGLTVESDPTLNAWTGYTDSRFNSLNATTTNVGTLTAYTGINLGGVFRDSWPVGGSGGAGSWWATSSDSLVGYPGGLSGDYSIVIGGSTVSAGTKFRVVGNTSLEGNTTSTGHLAALGGNSDQWNLAYSWGNHAAAGYASSTGLGTKLAKADFNTYFNNLYNATTTLNGFTPSNYFLASNFNSSWAAQYNATTTLNGFTPSNYLLTTNFGNQFASSYNATTTLNGFTNNQVNWNTAYSWGDHAAAGYASSTGLGTKLAKADFSTYFNNLYNATTTLNGFTPANYFLASNFNSSWATQYNATTTLNGFTNNQVNWNTAYSWGDHAAAGYASSTGLGTKLAKADFSTYFNNLYNATTTLNGFTPANYFLASNFNSSWAAQYNATTTLNGFTPSNYLLTTNFGTQFASSYNATTTLNGFTNNQVNWNTAYAWGDHAAAGYASSTGLGTKLAKADFSTYFNNLYNATTTLNGFTPANYFLASNFNSYFDTRLNASSTIAFGSCASNQILKWNGSAWACSADAGLTVESDPVWTASDLNVHGRIATLNATTTNIGTLQVYGNATTSGRTYLGQAGTGISFEKKYFAEALAGEQLPVMSIIFDSSAANSVTPIGSMVGGLSNGLYIYEPHKASDRYPSVGLVGDGYAYYGDTSYVASMQLNTSTRVVEFDDFNGYIFNSSNSTSTNSFIVNSNATTTGHLSVLNGNSDQWNLAYSWGNHAAAGYASSTGLGTKLAKADFNTYFNNLYNATTTLNGFTPSNYLLTANFGTNWNSSFNSTSTWWAFDSNWGRNYNATSTFGGNLNIHGNTTMSGNATTTGHLAALGGNSDQWNTAVTDLNNYFTNTKEPTGFVTRTNSSLSFNSTNRTFTITGTNFKVYSIGKEYLKNTESIQIADTVGLHFIYYAPSTLTLSEGTSVWNFDDGTIQIATVYWNSSEGVIGDERHGMTMDNITHEYLHDTVGTRYQSGLTGIFNTNNTLSMTDGIIDDEDIEHSIGATTTDRIIYRTGANFTYTSPTSTAYFDKTCTGNNLCYDNAGTKTAATANNYVAYWIFATNDPNTGIYSLMGQRQDTTLANAQANATYASLSLGNLPFSEMKLLYRVIVRNVAGNTLNISDYRSVSNLPAGTYVATAHNILTGLDYTSAGHTGFAGTGVENIFTQPNTFTVINATTTNVDFFTANSATTSDSLYVGGYASSTGGIFTKGNAHIGGTITIDGNTTSTGHLVALGGNSDQWNLAYSWGDHASAGYASSTGLGTKLAKADFSTYFNNLYNATTTLNGFTPSNYLLSSNFNSYFDTRLNASSTIAFGSCASNQILKWNGSAWACSADSGLTVESDPVWTASDLNVHGRIATLNATTTNIGTLQVYGNATTSGNFSANSILYAKDGSVGVGVDPTTLPAAGLVNIPNFASSKNWNVTSGVVYNNYFSTTFTPSSESSALNLGTAFSTVGLSANNQLGIIGITNSASYNGTGSLSYLTGMQSQVELSNAGSVSSAIAIDAGVNNGLADTTNGGNMTEAIGLNLLLNLGPKAGTVSSWKGINISTPTIDGGTLSNNYGIFIANQTGGAKNYSIYTGSGDVRFGGPVYASSTLLIQNNLTVYGTATSTFAGNIAIANGKDLQVSRIYSYSPLTVNADLYLNGSSTSTGRVVIGSTNPTTNDALYVNGNIVATGYASSTTGLFTQGNAHFGGNLSVDGNATTTGNLKVFGSATLATSTMAFSTKIGDPNGNYFTVENFNLGTIPADLFEPGNPAADIKNFVPLIKFSSPDLGINPAGIGAINSGLIIVEDATLNSNPKISLSSADLISGLTFNNVDIDYATTTKNLRIIGPSDGFTFSVDDNSSVQILNVNTTNGTMTVNGSITQTNAQSCSLSSDSNGKIICTSDETLKDVKGKFANGLNVILGIQPIEFSYLNESYQHIGFSAQNVKSVLPQATPIQKDGTLGLDINAILAATVNAIKEQQDQINVLKVNASSTQADLLTVSDLSDIEAGNLTVQESATFYGTILVKGEAGFEHKVTFYDDIQVNGKIYASKDQAGTVTVPANATAIDVVFEKEYLVAPKVVANLAGDDETTFVNFKIARKSAKGFSIILQSPVIMPITFDWIALAVKSEPPVIQSLTASADTANASSTVSFQANVSDSDNTQQDLQYVWELIPNIGSIVGSSNSVNWSLATSTVSSDTDIEVKVTVTDGSNIVTQSKIIKVLAGQVAGAQTEPVENISNSEVEPETPEPILGCTNSTATNYNAVATQDDGSCVLPE